jgi:hypothetical protein
MCDALPTYFYYINPCQVFIERGVASQSSLRRWTSRARTTCTRLRITSLRSGRSTRRKPPKPPSTKRPCSKPEQGLRSRITLMESRGPAVTGPLTTSFAPLASVRRSVRSRQRACSRCDGEGLHQIGQNFDAAGEVLKAMNARWISDLV